jgi:hypothetical protein
MLSTSLQLARIGQKIILGISKIKQKLSLPCNTYNVKKIFIHSD